MSGTALAAGVFSGATERPAGSEPAASALPLTLSKRSRAIELLQERRTALISAAVTGKIDVRDLTPTEAV